MRAINPGRNPLSPITLTLHTSVTIYVPQVCVRVTLLYLVLVSESCPLIGSSAVRRSTPFCKPMYRNRPPSCEDSCLSLSAPVPTSTMHTDSAALGSACNPSSSRQSAGLRETIRTVPSVRPRARNRHLCSPAGTVPRLMQITSLSSFLRSVYSFSCPVCEGKRWRDDHVQLPHPSTPGDSTT